MGVGWQVAIVVADPVAAADSDLIDPVTKAVNASDGVRMLRDCS